MTWASFAVSYYCLSPKPTPLSNFTALRVLRPVASLRAVRGWGNPTPTPAPTARAPGFYNADLLRGRQPACQV
jgi:hypothetical protein